MAKYGEPLTEFEIEVIKKMAYYSLNHSAVAKTTIYSRQRIEQVIYSIYKKTNLDPDKFYDLIKLLEKIKVYDEDE